MQDIFQLAFAAGINGSADVLLSSDERGSVKIWSVCPSAGIVCIWQVREHTCTSSTLDTFVTIRMAYFAVLYGPSIPLPDTQLYCATSAWECTGCDLLCSDLW